MALVSSALVCGLSPGGTLTFIRFKMIEDKVPMPKNLQKLRTSRLDKNVYGSLGTCKKARRVCARPAAVLPPSMSAYKQGVLTVL